MPGRTLPARVEDDDLKDLIELVARDCAPQQEIRELTQNSIEAIQRARELEPDLKGHIVWDVDWALHAAEGVYKLSIADNGDGMSAEEVKRYINRISSSAQQKSRFHNFGIGGKVTAGYHNPVGVLYRAWRSGNGVMATYWFDAEEGRYGLKQQQLSDGSFAHTVPITPTVDEQVRPQFIKAHGTVVTLCGALTEANTMQAPEGVPYPTHWLTKYLNRRYFTIPEYITLRVREFASPDPMKWPIERPSGMPMGGQLRTIRGQKYHLDKVVPESDRGAVALQQCTVHWWVLPEEPINQVDIWQCTGHAAALYKGELYELKDGKAGRSMLIRFGVLFGHRRVILYVEPRPSPGQTVESNTARTQLLICNEPIPWDDWGAEFREAMPERMRALMSEYLARSAQSNHSLSIRDRLKSILRLFRLSRYRRSSNGSSRADAFDEGGGRGGGNEPTRGGTRGGGSSRAGVGDSLASILSARGELVQQVQVEGDQPEVIWVTTANGTREPDELDDRAASYDPSSNKIKANADFRAFTDMVSAFEHQYDDVPEVKAIVEDAVREWFEQQLVEAVLGTKALRGSKRWNDDDMARILSEEALTMAVMPRYHVHMAIKRTLGHRIKSLLQESPSHEPLGKY